MSELSEKIKKYDQGLLPDMLQLKYSAMAENPYRFFRASGRLFYEDLAGAGGLPASPDTWICGDLHLENFGSYRGNNGLVYFDLNDFDEGLLAPAAWEVIRMVCSIFVAFDTLKKGGDVTLKMAALFLRTYGSTLSKGKAAAIEPRTAQGIVCDFLTSADKSRQKDMLEKRTVKKAKELALSLQDEHHTKLDKQLKTDLYAHVNDWIKNNDDGPYNYKVVSAVFRVAGTGSLGVKRYLMLLKSTNKKHKYLLLDMKQALPPHLAPLIATAQPDWATDADRIIAIQARMQYVPPALSSTTIFQNEPYTLQELQPVKDSIKFKLLKNYRDMYQVISDMAVLTASAQLRSGGRQGSAVIDELMAFGAQPDWQQPVLDYAFDYAAKVKSDYRNFVRDYKSGVFKSFTPTPPRKRLGLK